MINPSDRNTNIDRSDLAHQEGQKRFYAKPVLVKHGNLRDITLSLSNKGAADGASTGTKFTSKT
jgi:hypothetical protein